MIDVGYIVVSSSAPPEAFFDRWVDHASQPEWASHLEWFRMDTPINVGARGELKSKTDKPYAFRVTAFERPYVYANTIEMDDVELTIYREARPTEKGSRVELRAWLEGPRAGDLELEFRANVQRALEAEMAALTALVESELAG